MQEAGRMPFPSIEQRATSGSPWVTAFLSLFLTNNKSIFEGVPPGPFLGDSLVVFTKSVKMKCMRAFQMLREVGRREMSG